MWKFCLRAIPNYSQQRFALNSANATEISNFSERLEIRLHTSNNCSLFYDHVIEVFALGQFQIRILDYAQAQISAMTNH